MADKEAKLKEMSKDAREARRAYDRAYYAAHKEEAAERKRRYWERKAACIAAEKADAENSIQDAESFVNVHEWKPGWDKRKHAHWALDCSVRPALYFCSACGFKVKEMSKYCPNCGKRVEEAL